MGYQGYEIRQLKHELRGKANAIVTADIDKIVKGLTLSLAKTAKKEDDIKEGAAVRAKRLKEALDIFKDKGLMVLDKKSVITESDDVSEVILKYVKEGGEDESKK